MVNENEGKVVSLTNISSQDFTHQFGGIPYFVPKGETLMFPYDLAHHLAKHLSRRILIEGDKGAEVYDPKDSSMANGNGSILWNESTENDMIARILGETFINEVPAEKSEMEKLKAQVEELNKKFSTGKDALPEAKTEGYQDKGEIIESLKKLGIAVDARKSKAKLEEQLSEATKVTA